MLRHGPAASSSKGEPASLSSMSHTRLGSLKASFRSKLPSKHNFKRAPLGTLTNILKEGPERSLEDCQSSVVPCEGSPRSDKDEFLDYTITDGELELPKRNISLSLSRSQPLLEVLQPPPHYLENLHKQTFSSLIQDIRTKLIRSGGNHLQHYLDITAVLEAKHKTLCSLIRRAPHPATAEEVNRLLDGREERINPWAATPNDHLPNGGLLMRVTHKSSRSKRRVDGFLSDGWEGDLDTFQGRAKLIHNHITFEDGEPSLFISTTSSARDFIDRHIPYANAKDRQMRGPCHSTVEIHIINGNARLAYGWPLLRIRDQILRYNKDVPYSRILGEFADEYGLPFRICPEEIVGTWTWTEIRKYIEDNSCDYFTWHKNVAVPAFEEHECRRNLQICNFSEILMHREDE